MPKKKPADAAQQKPDQKPEKYLVTRKGGGQPTAVIYAQSENEAREKWAKRFNLANDEAEVSNVSPKDDE